MISLQILFPVALASLGCLLLEINRSLAAKGRHLTPSSGLPIPFAFTAHCQTLRGMQSPAIGESIARFNFHLFDLLHAEHRANRNAGDTEPRPSGPIEILAVGAEDWSRAVRDALRDIPSFRLCTAPDPRALWLIPKDQPIDVIVLHGTLSPSLLEDASRFIRRQWPPVRILVVRTGERFLEDALYDERVLPTVEPDALVAIVERLAEAGRRRGAPHGTR